MASARAASRTRERLRGSRMRKSMKSSFVEFFAWTLRRRWIDDLIHLNKIRGARRWTWRRWWRSMRASPGCASPRTGPASFAATAGGTPAGSSWFPCSKRKFKATSWAKCATGSSARRPAAGCSASGCGPRRGCAALGTRLLEAICAAFRRRGVQKVRTLLARDNALVLAFFRSQDDGRALHRAGTRPLKLQKTPCSRCAACSSSRRSRAGSSPPPRSRASTARRRTTSPRCSAGSGARAW